MAKARKIVDLMPDSEAATRASKTDPRATLSPPALTRTVLVVGGENPFGASVCEAFAGKGARIAIQHHGSRRRVLEIAARIAARDAVILPLDVDIAESREACRRLVERVVENFGRLDVVVVCAGAGEAARRGPVREEERVGKTSGLALTAAAWCAESAAPHLRRSRPAGHFIVLVGPSEVAEDGAADNDAGAKAELQTLVSSVAAEWSAGGSRACVNGVLPSRIGNATSLDDSPGKRTTRATAVDLSPSAWFDDSAGRSVARFIVDLASRRNVSGQVFELGPDTDR